MSAKKSAQKCAPNAIKHAHARSTNVAHPFPLKPEAIAELRKLALKYAAGVRRALAATTPRDPSPRLPSPRSAKPSRHRGINS